jgi:hypothetical protein
LRIIDDNSDGIVTSKEIKNFKVCDKYDGKKINKEFREYGRKADLNELSEDLSPKIGNFFHLFSLEKYLKLYRGY